jgi:hypothetical protein
MKSELVKTDKFSFIIFENVFDDQELNSIWKEAEFLCDKQKMMSPEETGSAILGEKILKKNSGVWLDSAYQRRDFSNYLNLYKKPFTETNFDPYIQEDYTLNLFKHTNTDQSLLSYYENTDYYDSHFDMSCYTYVYWMFKEPKSFTGGDFYFTDVDCKISVTNNTGVLFPGWANHHVDEITMINESAGNCVGRFVFSTFFNFKL